MNKIKSGHIVMAVVLLGSVCGLIEVIGSGIIRVSGIPFRAGMLTGLGFAVIGLGFGSGLFRKIFAAALGIGAVAVLVKQLAVPVLGVSVMCKMNSCIAVCLEYAALGAIASLVLSKRNSFSSRMMAGGAAALVSSVAFYFIGMNAAPCKYLLSFNSMSGFGLYLLIEGLSWTFFGALLFPAGIALGEKISDKTSSFINERPGVFGAVSSFISLMIWVLTAYAISKGV